MTKLDEYWFYLKTQTFATKMYLFMFSSDGDHSNRSSTRRRHHHHHHEHFKQEDLIMRRQPGSEVHLNQALHNSPTETEEAMTLYKSDLEGMASMYHY